MHTLSLRLKIIQTHCYHAALKTIRSICAAVTRISPAPERYDYAVFGAALPSSSPFLAVHVTGAWFFLSQALRLAISSGNMIGMRKISKSEWFVLPGYLQYDIYYHKNARFVVATRQIGFDVVTFFSGLSTGPVNRLSNYRPP
jgi:hypothetical protein